MAEFRYKARTITGEPREGAVEARTSEAAIEALHRSNLIVVEIKPVEAGPLLGWAFGFFKGVSQRDLVIFSRQLSTLFQAKVPVIQSLKTLAAESGNPSLQTIVGEILDDVSGGSSLSQAMIRHPETFSRFYTSMIRAGEESGKLDDVFLFLADYLERSYDLVSKARNALIYPAFVLTAFVGVIVVMLVSVIPRLTNIFKELGQQAPFYTRVIIGISVFIQQWGFFILVLLIAGGVLLWRFYYTKKGEEFFDELKLKVPFGGGLLKKIYLARLTDNLSTLIAAGIPIIRALEITGDVVANTVYRRIISDAAESVKAGKTISSSFDRFREIPPLVTQMIHIGEESGKLDFILKNAAGFYQRDVENLLENFVSLIEPALIISLGLGVGILVAAVLVPLYNLASVL